MKKLIFVSLIFSILQIQAQTSTSFFNGVSTSTGNLKPEGETYGISLQNELIHIRALDTSVLYDVLYEFKNTNASYGNFTVMQPVTLYFNEFRPGLRSDMLAKLAIVFSDLFKVQDPGIDIRKQLKENFQDRLFVRRYVNSQNLKAMGIIAEIFKNNQRSQYKKIMIEFRWMDEDPYNLTKDTEVLVMEIKFSTDFSFNPNEQFNLLCFMKLPSTICGITEKQIFAPYQISYDKNWEGSIKNLYIRHDAFAVTPVLPSSYKYTTKFTGEKEQVLIIKSTPQTGKQHIGFYAVLNDKNACGKTSETTERLLIPSAIKNISASSYTKENKQINNRNFLQTNEVIVSDSIKTYQTGNPTDLDFLAKDFRPKAYPSELNSLLKAGCKNGILELNLQQSGHPAYAFDVSNFNENDTTNWGKQNLQMQTCWCEGAEGTGEGEYIEFELMQPVSFVRIYNGNWYDDKTFTDGSKPNIIRFHSVDNLFEDKKFSIIDLKIQNLYPIALQPGKYRIYIDDADAGKVENSCISSISFGFDMQDDWYKKSMNVLENVYKKPK
ncbi:MAG: NADase-type glycan-binding domain-containing protein [Chitinophagales bacterium]